MVCPSRFATVATGPPASMVATTVYPLLLILAMVSLASSMVYPRNSAHCVEPSQKKGLSVAVSTKYRPLGLTFRGPAAGEASSANKTANAVRIHLLFVKPNAPPFRNQRRQFI